MTARDHGLTIHASVQPIRWLGVWFDSKLRFTEHVKRKAAQARNVVRHLRSLANTQRGPPPRALRKTIFTCVLPILTYGAEAWYEGRTKTRKFASRQHNTEVSTRQEAQIDEIDRVLREAIRAVLPIWKTTPIATLYRDAGVPTARIALEAAFYRFGQRLQSMDNSHMLTARTALRPYLSGRGYGSYQPTRTRLQRAARLLPTIPRPQYLLKRYTFKPDPQKDKKTAAKEFIAWQSKLPDTHLVVFSDGSKGPDEAVGWGFVIYKNGRKIRQGKGRLGLAEVFDGEAVGAWQGLRQAHRINPGATIHVCLDNTSVIQGLTGTAPKSSQEVFLAFQEIATIADVRIRWVPGYEGIQGNEEADRLAKEEAALPARRSA